MIFIGLIFPAEKHIGSDQTQGFDLQPFKVVSIFLIVHGLVNYFYSMFSDSSIEGIWITNSTLKLRWTGVFSSSSASSLVYEVSIGKAEGWSDVLQWVETMDTELLVSPLQHLTDYYVTVTGINGAGLYETTKFVLN